MAFEPMYVGMFSGVRLLKLLGSLKSELNEPQFQVCPPGAHGLN